MRHLFAPRRPMASGPRTKQVGIIGNWSRMTLIHTMNLAAAVLLFFAPWLLGFADQSMAAWNAWLTGAAIGAVVLAEIFGLTKWAGMGSLALGLWTMASPWAFGFAAIEAALSTHVVVGLIVALLAAIELWMTYPGSSARAYA